MGGGLIQSVVRALDLLQAVGDAEAGLTVGELAGVLGVKVPTAFNLARTLVSRGYLERTVKRPIRYRLGPAVGELAECSWRRGWRLAAAAEVRALCARLETATVLLAEAVGGDTVPCLRLDSARPEVLEQGGNRHLAPYGAAVVLAFQAFASGPEVEAFRARYPFSEYGQGAWSSLDELEAFLAVARVRGVVLVEWPMPVRAAAPVYGVGGALIACLGASTTRATAPPGPGEALALAAAVRASAARLSAVASGRPPEPPPEKDETGRETFGRRQSSGYPGPPWRGAGERIRGDAGS